jgi:hypothetical protein
MGVMTPIPAVWRDRIARVRPLNTSVPPPNGRIKLIRTSSDVKGKPATAMMTMRDAANQRPLVQIQLPRVGTLARQIRMFRSLAETKFIARAHNVMQLMTRPRAAMNVKRVQNWLARGSRM